MKGSGIVASKTKAIVTPQLQIQAPMLPVGFEQDTSFEKFPELPKEIRENIMSRGIKESAMRPGKQLEFILQTVPGVEQNKEFLLPKSVNVYFIKGVVERNTFTTFNEYRDYFESLFKNADENKFDLIDIIHEYLTIRISIYSTSPSGVITITILSSNKTGIAQLSFKFERVKKQYNVIAISSVSLNVSIYEDSEIDELTDIFVGIRWLLMVFKEVKVNKLISFENPENIKITYKGQLVSMKDIEPELQKKLMLLMHYIQLNLKPKKITKVSRKSSVRK